MSELQVGDLFEWYEQGSDLPHMGIVRDVRVDGSYRVSGKTDPCATETLGDGWSSWVNEPKEPAPSGGLSVFDVTLTATHQLSLDEIWPDSDGPEVPTAEDVKAVMESCGSKVSVLQEWMLLGDLHVTVEDVEVW